LSTLEDQSPARAGLRARLRGLKRPPIVFILTVLVPTILSVLYYGLVASDVYISESRFVVRRPQRSEPSELGSLLAGTGFARSQDETYSVHDYTLSRDALRELDRELGLVKAYSANSVDVINRFPGLDWDRSFEAFFRYYTDHVDVEYDSASAITTLQVRAFSPELARDMNERLLQMSERLVNQLNERSRLDLVQVAEREVAKAESRNKEAAIQLAAYRSKGAIYDPDRESALQLDTVTRLREELRLVEAQVGQLQQVAPSNPQIATLQAQATRLRRSISDENSRVVGQSGSLSAKSPAFYRLALEKDFADKQLGTALASLEAARGEAARKQLYLERLVQPNLPDKALEPRRLRSAFTVFVLGLIAWGVLSLLLAGIREHAD
jgi:capsular polysaccharide transport system permease protein